MRFDYILGHLIALIIAIEYENWRIKKWRLHQDKNGDMTLA